MAVTRLQRCWQNMHRRCDTLSIDKKRSEICYIGIGICREWNEFETFKTWSLANGYQDSLTLDRIKSHLGYFPSNCRWVTYSEQCFNTTTRGVSKFRGVCTHQMKPHHSLKWRAQYVLNGKRTYIGVFDTQLDAALAYDQAVYIANTGAKLNFPERYSTLRQKGR